MAAPSRDLIVNLIGKTNKLLTPLQGASARMQKIGGTLSRTLTPAAAALGVGMKMAAAEFNRGADALRVGTGAVGSDLKTMTGQMKRLSTDSTLAAIGMGRVGAIMADVATRTGAAGKELEDLTRKFGQLERMGVPASVANITRTFGDWSIATADQSKAMDTLFVASQASGASMDTLAARIVQFGAPLRNLGFGFEEAVALMGSFEKNGVNTETVMAGLKIGIGTLAKAGEAVPDTFRRIVSEIKNTADASDATRIAIKLFGQRSGPDLADAIRNGQFAVEDMEKAIADSKDTIDAAAESTVHLSDNLDALKNKVVSFLGPWGEIGGAVAAGIAAIGPFLFGVAALMPVLANAGAAFATASAFIAANVVTLGIAAVAVGALTGTYFAFKHAQKDEKKRIEGITGAMVDNASAIDGVRETVSKLAEDSNVVQGVLDSTGMSLDEVSEGLLLTGDAWDNFSDRAASAAEVVGGSDAMIQATELLRQLHVEVGKAAGGFDELARAQANSRQTDAWSRAVDFLNRKYEGWVDSVASSADVFKTATAGMANLGAAVGFVTRSLFGTTRSLGVVADAQDNVNRAISAASGVTASAGRSFSGFTDRTRELENAQRSLTSAQRNQESSSKSLVEAKADEVDAVDAVRVAEERLAAVKNGVGTGTDEAVSANERAQKAALARRTAELELADAVDNLGRVQSGGDVKFKDLERAQIRVASARISAREAAVASTKAEAEYNQTVKGAPKGSARLTKAQDALNDARDDAAKAAGRVSDAEDRLTDANRSVSDSLRGIRDAQSGANSQMGAGVVAARDLEGSQLDVERAVDDSAEALLREAKRMSGLNDSSELTKDNVQSVVDNLVKLESHLKPGGPLPDAVDKMIEFILEEFGVIDRRPHAPGGFIRTPASELKPKPTVEPAAAGGTRHDTSGPPTVTGPPIHVSVNVDGQVLAEAVAEANINNGGQFL